MQTLQRDNVTLKKVFIRIILDTIKSAVDELLRDQAGFRKERLCTDQIATLRIIIDQTVKMKPSSADA